MTNSMIEAVGLHKSFGETHALSGLDFDVREGTILGMLGPNGAGKTTAVRILTTLTHPDSGSATVAGIDVLRHPAKVRAQIGVAGPVRRARRAPDRSREPRDGRPALSRRWQPP